MDLAAAGPVLHELERRTPRLSAADRERAQAIGDAALREEWIASHIALRLLIERSIGEGWRGVPLARSAAGKPSLEGAPLSFSLSHAPDVALIGLTPCGSIGVDIERLRQARMDMARRRLIEEAGSALIAANPLPAEAGERFLRAWVRLEALAKAEGCGIGRLLSRLGIVASRKELRIDAEALATAVAVAEVRDVHARAGVLAAAAFIGCAPTDAASWLPTTREGLQDLVS